MFEDYALTAPLPHPDLDSPPRSTVVDEARDYLIHVSPTDPRLDSWECPGERSEHWVETATQGNDGKIYIVCGHCGNESFSG